LISFKEDLEKKKRIKVGEGEGAAERGRGERGIGTIYKHKFSSSPSSVLSVWFLISSPSDHSTG